MLTKTNYTDWAALMRVMLQGRHLWEAISIGAVDYTDDRNALEALCKAVPEELRGSIANKTTAKAAWDSLKTRYIGVDQVRPRVRRHHLQGRGVHRRLREPHHQDHRSARDPG
jgi:hypothetical protein